MVFMSFIICAESSCLDLEFRVQALVLSPTRELASQTEKVTLAIGDYINVQAYACIGGKSIGQDIKKLKNGVHVVSGTPGRVFYMIKRSELRTKSIKLLVLDESDEMLSRGFKDKIYDVYRCLPPLLQAFPSNPFSAIVFDSSIKHRFSATGPVQHRCIQR
ncbi:hypothetical protein KSP40_PGU016665 [Platanthera guangdongensis]|uniref:Helicase ATP-binding domain-containing protein n=1 Tax=Platanthera guangdongensis TaxID=2320717 RepID=A0ABR2N2M7_9ASPA